MSLTGTDILHAQRLLEQGELVAIPTETVYGLAADALNPTAVTKIFKAKNRPSFDPLIVHVPDFDSARKFATNIPEPASELAARFWPGPLTMVLPRNKSIPDIVTSGLETVGIRCPNHPLTLSLLRNLSFPLAAPSANPFGYVSPTRAEHVRDQLGNHVSYVLDGGPCQIGIESTIIGFENDQVVIYRLGGLSQEEIESIAGTVKIQIQSTSNPLAPGQLESHYSPNKKLVLGNIDALLREFYREKVAVLSFQKNYGNTATKHNFILSPRGSLEEAAQNLFFALRELDKVSVDIILAEEVPDQGLGRAINDRLRRASVKRA